MAKPPTKPTRTSQGLRDILFDEIEELRSGNGDPWRALAVSQLAKQIVSTVRAEMNFMKQVHGGKETSGDVAVGTMVLGTLEPAPSVPRRVKGRS